MSQASVFSFKEKWRELKEEVLLTKECLAYNPEKKPTADHLEIIENNHIVMEHVQELAQFFGFSTGTEIAYFAAILIHSGYLSEGASFQYKKGIQDLKNFFSPFMSEEIEIFRGTGSCRHIAAMEKAVLNQMKIKNSIVSTAFTDADPSIQWMWLFLHQFHKNHSSSKANHVINYIEEENYSFFVDATNENLNVLEGKDQFAHSGVFNTAPMPLFSYDYFVFNDEFVDFRHVQLLTVAQKEDIHEKLSHVRSVFLSSSNAGVLREFFAQNRGYYHKINQAHQRIEEKEQRMDEFIKSLKKKNNSCQL